MKQPMQPRDVKPDRARKEVVIAWTDGHTSRLPYQLLRGWCPCAECQGHGAGVTFKNVPPVDFVRVEPVGLYGAQFTWTDGHSLGIFRFETLRELCCCDACTAQRQGKPPRPSNAL